MPYARVAVRPKDLLNRLAPLLPATHSPIQPATRNAYQKAYLAEVDRAVVDLVLATAQLPAVDLLVAPTRTAADFATTLDDFVEREIQHDVSLDDTIREQLVRARRRQGCFASGFSTSSRSAGSPG